MRPITIVTLCLAATLGCSSSTPAPSASSLTISADDTHGLSIAVSQGLVLALLDEALDHGLDCKGEIDSELEAMLLTLDRRRWSRAELRDDDTVVIARRRNKKLRLEIEQEDGLRLEATMPWAVGECLLGRNTTVKEALGVDGRGHDIDIKVHGADGGTYAFTVD